MQRNLDDLPIRLPRLFNPIPKARHIVLRQLDAGHKAKDRILKHQQKNRACGADAAKQQKGRTVHQHADDDNQPHRVGQNFEHLKVALQRAGLRGFSFLVNGV